MSFLKGFMSLFDWFSAPKSYNELSKNLVTGKWQTQEDWDAKHK